MNKFIAVLCLMMTVPNAQAEILTNGLLGIDGFSSYRILEANGLRVSAPNNPGGIPGYIESVIDPINLSRYVMKTTITNEDQPLAGGFRSEVSGYEDPLYTERWYGFGFLIPSEWSSTKNGVNLFQIHDRADSSESAFRQATFHMLINPVDQIKFYNAYDADQVTTPPDVHPVANVDYTYRQLTEFSMSRDRWTYIVINAKWAADDTGFLSIWKDGELLFAEQGHINTFNDIRGPWFKAGTYVSSAFTGWSNLSSFSTGVVVGDSAESMASITHLIAGHVPEPSSAVLMALGFVALVYRRSH